MSSEQEVVRILQMVQARKISADEGVKLLKALPRLGPRENSSSPGSLTQGMKTYRWMRILIADQKTGKEKINIRLPGNVVETGVKMGACYCPGLNSNVTQRILESLRAGLTGKVIDSISTETGERIVISLE